MDPHGDQTAVMVLIFTKGLIFPIPPYIPQMPIPGLRGVRMRANPQFYKHWILFPHFSSFDEI